ncbi:MAG: hypothetical protein V7693_16010 [Halopseudomonas sabulinigri]
MAGWSALPTWWVREPGLADFLGGGKAGASIAELKTYIGLTVLADFKTKKVKTSISDLELLTGLSRPMVIRGIKGLESRGMLNVVRDGHINHYELIISDTDDKWGKVPNDALRLHLPEIINRGAVTLAALKIYILIASLRPNSARDTAIGHKKIREHTGIQTRHVRAGLDILINHGLIHIDQDESGGHSKYTMIGLKL